MNMGTKYGSDDPQGDLATYFEKSATLVRHLFERCVRLFRRLFQLLLTLKSALRLEEDYIGPWIQLARESFAAYPIPVVRTFMLHLTTL